MESTYVEKYMAQDITHISRFRFAITAIISSWQFEESDNTWSESERWRKFSTVHSWTKEQLNSDIFNEFKRDSD